MLHNPPFSYSSVKTDFQAGNQPPYWLISTYPSLLCSYTGHLMKFRPTGVNKSCTQFPGSSLKRGCPPPHPVPGPWMWWRAVLNCRGHEVLLSTGKRQDGRNQGPLYLGAAAPALDYLHEKERNSAFKPLVRTWAQSCVLTNAYTKFTLLINII